MIKLSKKNKRGGMPIEKDIPCPEISTLKGHQHWLDSVDFHSSLSLLATGSNDNTAKLWRVNHDGSVDETPVASFEGHSGTVFSVAFHPAAPILATGSLDKTAKLWRFRPDGSAEHTPISTLNGHKGSVTSVAFHRTLPFFATGSSDKTVKLWRVNPDGSVDENPVYTSKPHSDVVDSVAFHPKAPILAIGLQENNAKLLRFRPEGSIDETHIATLKGHKNWVHSVAFHPTLPLLATGSLDKTTKLWRVYPDGSVHETPVATLEGHIGPVWSVAFHPTAPLLATGSCFDDDTAKLWHLNPDGSGATCVATLKGHNKGVQSVAFHPTLPLLATGSWDKTAKLWGLTKIFEYLRRIAITRAGLTSRLIKAFTTENLESRTNLRFSNSVQGRIGNPPDMKYNTMENSGRRDEILSKKYVVFPRAEAVALPPMLASQPVLPFHASAAVEFPSLSSVCRVDDTSCEALYESIPWERLNDMPGSCSEAAVIMEKLKQLKRLLILQEKPPIALNDRWIKLLEEKISSCKP
jgi:WD40 repeat protein